MPPTTTSSSAMYSHVHSKTHRFEWPSIQLYIWKIVMLVGSLTILGIMANFISIQQRLQQPVPWYLGYWISVAVLTLIYMIILLVLLSKGRLVPSIVVIGAFIMLIMWLVGLIIVSIELWGPVGSINSQCNLVVFSKDPQGLSDYTFSWLQQRNICQSWHAVFAFALIGSVFLFWIIIMSYQVFANS